MCCLQEMILAGRQGRLVAACGRPGWHMWAAECKAFCVQCAASMPCIRCVRQAVEVLSGSCT